MCCGVPTIPFVLYPSLSFPSTPSTLGKKRTNWSGIRPSTSTQVNFLSCSRCCSGEKVWFEESACSGMSPIGGDISWIINYTKCQLLPLNRGNQLIIVHSNCSTKQLNPQYIQTNEQTNTGIIERTA